MYHFFYKITNNFNGKYYYGVHSTNDLNDGYMGSGYMIKKLIKKYGKDSFTKEILKYFDNEEEMFSYEKYFLTEDIINNEKCYNLVGGGNGYTVGHYVSNEVKEKISLKAKNRKSQTKGRIYVNKNYVNKMINPVELDKYILEGWQKGVYLSEESREKIKNGPSKKKGIPLSEEARKKMSMAKKGKPAKNKGIPLSEETKKKLSIALKGKKFSDERKEICRQCQLGRKHSEDSKRKRSEKLKGHLVSQETRDKISNANRGRKRKLTEVELEIRRKKRIERKKKYGKRICVNNGEKNRFIEQHFLKDFLRSNPDYTIGLIKHKI